MTSNARASRLFTHLSASAPFYILLSPILLLGVWEALSHFPAHNGTQHARDKTISRATRPLYYLLGAEFGVSIALSKWIRRVATSSEAHSIGWFGIKLLNKVVLTLYLMSCPSSPCQKRLGGHSSRWHPAFGRRIQRNQALLCSPDHSRRAGACGTNCRGRAFSEHVTGLKRGLFAAAMADR